MYLKIFIVYLENGQHVLRNAHHIFENKVYVLVLYKLWV